MSRPAISGMLEGLEYIESAHRQTGRTSAMLKIMEENPDSIMIVHTAMFGEDLASRTGIHRSRFISIYAMDRFRGAGKRMVLMDNAAIYSVANIAMKYIEKMHKEMREKSEVIARLYSENEKMRLLVETRNEAGLPLPGK